ncbi:MAG: ATP-binding cassette domain-containing protein, partial [Candidatus Bathyarchaeota archaeon]|nr:ATP-binding cassette domain-containing protein [Candidatus Bathyarchaeota archaeon]
MNPKPYIEMKSIHKVYPDGTIALRGVDLEVRRGEIVGLLGENGAGKTTLMKILSGLLPLTSGEIHVGGKSAYFDNPSDALRVGIGMVHQHFALVSTYTPVQNILLGQESASVSLIQPLSFLRQKATREKLATLAEETGLSIPLDTPVE